MTVGRHKYDNVGVTDASIKVGVYDTIRMGMDDCVEVNVDEMFELDGREW